jgi:hypothetical protein
MPRCVLTTGPEQLIVLLPESPIDHSAVALHTICVSSRAGITLADHATGRVSPGLCIRLASHVRHRRWA